MGLLRGVLLGLVIELLVAGRVHIFGLHFFNWWCIRMYQNGIMGLLSWEQYCV